MTVSEPLQIDVIRDLETFRRIRGEWDELLEHSATKTLYQTHVWNEIWLEHYLQRGDQLCILAARRDGRLTGIAPFFLRPRRVNGLPERALAFVGGQNFASDFCDFIIRRDEPGCIDALVTRLFGPDLEWTLIELTNYPAESPHYAELTRAFSSRARFAAFDKIADSPTLIFDDHEAARSLLKKKSIKNKFNYLSKQGELRFLELDTPDQQSEYLRQFFDQHIDRWSALSKRSLFANPLNTGFYRTLVQRIGALGWLRFSVLLLDGKPIAFHFGFELEGRFYYYKPTFDIRIAAHSPGQVLLRFLLERAIDRKLKEFDFTLGDEAYKYRFANRIRENFKITVYRRRSSLHLRKLRSALGRAKRAIVKSRAAVSEGD